MGFSRVKTGQKWVFRPTFWISLTLMALGLDGCCFSAEAASSGPHWGPLFDHFGLTLSDGDRNEAAGPFYYRQKKDSERIWAVPPLISYTKDPEADYEEFD